MYSFEKEVPAKYHADIKDFFNYIKELNDGLYYREKPDMEYKILSLKDVEYLKKAFEDGCYLMENSFFLEAGGVFAKTIKMNCMNPECFVKRANCFIELRRPDEAEEDCITALLIDEDFEEAYFLQSQALEMKGDFRNAIKTVLNVVILDPSNIKARHILRRLRPIYYEEMRMNGYSFETIEKEEIDMQRGSDLFLQSLRASQESENVIFQKKKIQAAEIYYNKGKQYLRRKMWDGALDAYFSALTLNPDEPKYYSDRAQCFFEKKQYELATFSCSMALKKDPKMLKPYIIRALAKKALGNLRGARSDAELVLKSDKNNFTARTLLAETKSIIEDLSYPVSNEVF